MSGIVQYVIVRGDLMKTMQWPAGAVIAQACHACTAVTHLFYNDAYTKTYLSDLDNMHKVILEAPDEKSLNDLHTKLEESQVHHKLWIEQPENIPTCLVVKPYPKEVIYIQHYIRNISEATGLTRILQLVSSSNLLKSLRRKSPRFFF